MTEESFLTAKTLITEKSELKRVISDIRSGNARIEMQIRDIDYAIPASVVNTIRVACETRMLEIDREFYELK